ncbi:hypothetical protein DL764_008642 [Monosporascus ibericus]|uniref:Uncharacterized protein n=1 Tax=Monosporascus ibericus TaxID=155417 RepID=A0A4Q4SWZ1_9PEZI|nr:hypothetical protein DL764_008642 [Monosporascus ibericus]
MHRAFLVGYFAQRRGQGVYKHGVARQQDKVNPDHLTLYNPNPMGGRGPALGPQAGPNIDISDEFMQDGVSTSWWQASL